MAYVEGHASWSRRGTNGIEQVATAGLTAALFEHRTSRAPDPQLHTHALGVNKARCVDGVWRTLDGKEVFDHQKTAGMIYQNALRNEMRRTLGVEFGPVSKDGQADIVGMPTALLKLWSKRTEAIEAEAVRRSPNTRLHSVPRAGCSLLAGTSSRGSDQCRWSAQNSGTQLNAAQPSGCRHRIRNDRG